MATEVASLPKPPQEKEGNVSLKERLNKQYSFKDEHVISLFKLLQKSNKLKLPEARRPEEVDKVDDPKYCLYHRMIRHPTKNCYVFKDMLQALIDAEVLKLRPEQKTVTANAVSLQFGEMPYIPTGVAPIPRAQLRLLNTDPHGCSQKGLTPVPAPKGEIMWVHQDLIKDQQ